MTTIRSRSNRRRTLDRSRTGTGPGPGLDAILSSDADVASQQFVRQKLARLAAARARRQRLTRAIDDRRAIGAVAEPRTRAASLARRIGLARLARLKRHADFLENEAREFHHEKRLEGYVAAASDAVSGAAAAASALLDERACAREIVEDMCAHVSGKFDPICRRYDEELCEACGARKFLIPHEATLVCPKCTRSSRLVHPTAAGVVHTLDDDVDANASSHTSANRNPHLLRQLAFYLVAQRKGVPIDVCERIHRWIVKNRNVRARADGRREHVAAAVRALRLKKYESYCSTIYSMIFGRAPLMLTPAERVRFYCAFRAAQENGAPRTYRMCIGLLFELMGLDECAEDFLQATMVDRPHTSTKRHSATPAFISQCEQWETACLRLGWPVSDRVAAPLRRHRAASAATAAKATAAKATESFFAKLGTPPTPTPTPPAPTPMFLPSLPPLPPVFETVPAPVPPLFVSPPSPPAPAPAPAVDPISGPKPTPPPKTRTLASRSLRYKLALECDSHNFLKRGTVHYVPTPATWAQVRYYILTSGGRRDPPLDRKTKLCTTHCVAWRHADWTAENGANARRMQLHWLNDDDDLTPDDRLVVARLPCSVGYELKEPAATTLATLASETERLRFVIDHAGDPFRPARSRDCADPRNHDCNAPSTGAERKRARPYVLKVPHGIPADRLRVAAKGETPVYFKDGKAMVLKR